MEEAGAAVTRLESPMSHLWGTVPFEGANTDTWRREFAAQIRRVRNSFWYVHQQKRSRVEMVEADPCALPAELGPFDMTQSLAARTRRTLVGAEAQNASLAAQPLCHLLPYRGAGQIHTWRRFTPTFFVSVLGLLGFAQIKLLFHRQKQPAEHRTVAMFTVVGTRPDTASA